MFEFEMAFSCSAAAFRLVLKVACSLLAGLISRSYNEVLCSPSPKGMFVVPAALYICQHIDNHM